MKRTLTAYTRFLPNWESRRGANEFPQRGSTLLQLPAKYRVVVMLRDIEQLSADDVARQLGLTVPAVKTRLLRGRLMLRESRFAGGSSRTRVAAIPVPRLPRAARGCPAKPVPDEGESPDLPHIHLLSMR